METPSGTNQKPAPNFDFIVNQDDPGPNAGKKKMSKKLIILLVLVVITIILLIAGMLFSTSSNVNEEQVTTRQETDQPTAPTEQETIKKFFELVQQDKYEEAYDTYIDPQGGIERDVFINEAVPLLKGLNLGACDIDDTKTILDVEVGDEEPRVVVACPVLEGVDVIDMAFNMNSEGESVKIFNYQLVDSE